MMISRTTLSALVSLLALVLAPAAFPTEVPNIPEMHLDFMEDFQSGIDPSVWYLENVQGAQWTWAVEGANGYATCVSAQNSPTNFETDMLTTRYDFTDFVVMWDMRFHTDFGRVDWRDMYFRATNNFNPVGYRTNIEVGAPAEAADMMGVGHQDTDFAFRQIGLMDCPWDKNEWYTFKLQALGKDIKVKVWEKGEVEPPNWMLEVTDSDPGVWKGRIGFGNYASAHTDVDNIFLYIFNPTPVEPTTWGAIKALYGP